MQIRKSQVDIGYEIEYGNDGFVCWGWRYVYADFLYVGCIIVFLCIC